MGIGGTIGNSEMPTLEAVGITKRYGGQTALDAVSFTAYRGELLGLIGPNGAGKTTLLECLAGLLPADAGTVIWGGESLSPAGRKSVLFYVPDGIVPYAEHAVDMVLDLVRAIYRLPASHVGEVVTALGLGQVLRHRIGALSKGYRRRLLLAVGLLTPHPFLMMDEPFDGFDLRQTREVMAVLRRFVQQGRTLFLSVHQLTDAERICNRFILLQAGQVRGEGALEELRAMAGISSGGLEEVFLAVTS